MYHMILEETDRIRENGNMMFASRSVLNLDRKDVQLPKRLEDDNVLDMLQDLCKEVRNVKEKLNKEYRNKFFNTVKRKLETDPIAPRSRRSRDSGRRGDRDRGSRYEDSYRDDRHRKDKYRDKERRHERSSRDSYDRYDDRDYDDRRDRRGRRDRDDHYERRRRHSH